jgi:putative N6-adenine-specific DNA methylase
MLIGNPPYGERLGDADEARALYRRMPSLFEKFPGWKSGFLTTHTDFEKEIGKKAVEVKKIKSGNLDTLFYMFV